jgi:hypothetical protein
MCIDHLYNRTDDDTLECAKCGLRKTEYNNECEDLFLIL